jgi:flagellar protein FlaF
MQNGVHAYAAAARSGLSGRTLEATVLKRCALDLQRTSANAGEDPGAFMAALERNRRAWSIFAEEIRDDSSTLPQAMRANMLRMAVFVFRRTAELADGAAPKGADMLIALNRSLAAGLEGDAG